jgi:hypothetical protein
VSGRTAPRRQLPGDPRRAAVGGVPEAARAGLATKSVALTVSFGQAAMRLCASSRPRAVGSVTVWTVVPLTMRTRGAVSQPCPCTRLETRTATPPGIGSTSLIVPSVNVATVVEASRVELVCRGNEPSIESRPPSPTHRRPALVGRDADPEVDGTGGEVDAVDAAHRGRVAVRRGRHVERAVGECQRAPDELAAEIGEDAQRPAVVLGAGRQVERVQAAEGVGDVERVRGFVDDAGADDAVAVELLAALGELADVGAPAQGPLRGERRDLARGRRSVRQRR